MEESTVWKLIDVYFKENPQALVRHHIDSYNQFIEHDIFQIMRDMSPLTVRLNMDKNTREFQTNCHLYFGGKDGKRVYFGKPVIFDPDNSHYMFPNEARLRDMTYAVTIHYDIEVEYTRTLQENEAPTEVDENGYIVLTSNTKDEDENVADGSSLTANITPSEMAKLRESASKSILNNVQTVKMVLEKVYLGKFPVMVQSNLCILNNTPRLMRYALGECKNDIGGYFIIDGKEKVIVPQESFGDNMVNVSKSTDDKFLYSLDMKSISENISKPRRTLSIRIIAPTAESPNLNIGVYIPNMGEIPIPLFIVFRALGVLTDKDIISFCTLAQPERTHPSFLPYLDACIHDAASIVTQEEAIYYISLAVKSRSEWRAKHILADFFLPHIGEENTLEKAYYLGYLTNRLLSVAVGIEPPTDRDSYKYKRVTLIGPLLKNLMSDYYQLQLKYIHLQIETIRVYNEKAYRDIGVLLHERFDDIFQKRIVEEGIRKAFKGNWGAHSHTKIVGVLQDLNRLSHNSMLNHLRKTNLPMDSSMKIVAPRVLHGSQWGIIDPIDTPDGGNVGLHKHLSLFTHITTSLSREPLIQWLKKHTPLVSLQQSNPIRMGKFTKVFINGHWIGGIADPHTFVNTVKLHRRHGLIPITISVMMDYARRSILLSTDGGRLCRPIFYKDEMTHEFIFQNSQQWNKISSFLYDNKNKNLWTSIVSGFHPKKVANFNPYKNDFYEWNQLYDLDKSEIQTNKALMEYLDTQETEGTLIAMHNREIASSLMKHTHCELHPSTTYGMMCNMINFIEHNPASRNSFSCGQSKQACSLYSSNYQLRMDKSALIINQGQIPLVKSRYLEYINNEESPYGENAMVAIMCYTGYNVEDAILINEAALQRGLFRTTYFNTYSSHEEKETKHQVVIREKTFSKVMFTDNVSARRIDPDFDYSYLDDNGLIQENTEVHDKMVLIGQTETVDDKGNLRDASILPKKGQMGYVDKVFMTEGEEGQRIAKVRIRHERIPAMGDKFASRAGQKGTIGMVIPEANMPFTKDGVRPDMIINPHALPSRMTIGQMVESIIGKACAMKGAFGDCTAFSDNKNKIAAFGELLAKQKFHSSGDEILYNGMNGKQIEASIFIGPTYYMRLKHMVKDKINYRARGPITKLTRQPVSGRANDGGLRIGEMERDAVISHGMSHFLQESMMERADSYQLAVCNNTGMVSIYNPNRDLMLSPAADGPIQYGGSLHQNGQMEVRQMSKYGRSFSIVNVPYAMKLLMQELQAIQVQMRIITEDNVNQIHNMNFSHNLKLLTKDEHADIQVIMEKLRPKNKMNKEKRLDSEDVKELLQKPEVEEDDDEDNDNENDEENVATEDTNSTAPIDTDTSVEKQPVGPSTPSMSPPKPEVELFENEVLRESSKYPGRYYVYNEKTGKTIWILENNQRADQQGGGNAVEEYRHQETPFPYYPLNSEVLLRNCPDKPDRIWTISDIGQNQYTISTNDLDNNLSLRDSIRVVSPEDIYSNNPMFANPIMGAIEPDYPPPPSIYDTIEEQQQQPYTNATEQPNINFNPVIKVFNHGNDMSIADKQSNTEDDLINPNPNIIQQPTQEDNIEEVTPPSSTIAPPIDFNHLIIKKNP